MTNQKQNPEKGSNSTAPSSGEVEVRPAGQPSRQERAGQRDNAYEVNVRGKDWAQAIEAPTAGKAKYRYLLGVREAWDGITFKHLTCRRLKSMPLTPTEIAQLESDVFNRRYPIGTRLKYWSWLHEGEPTGIAAIKHHATVVCSSAVIWLDGVSSCISITHVEAVHAPAPDSARALAGDGVAGDVLPERAPRQEASEASSLQPELGRGQCS